MSIFFIDEPVKRKQKTQMVFTKQSNLYYKSQYVKNSLSKGSPLTRGKNLTKRYGYGTDSFYVYKTKPVYFKRGNNYLLLGDIF